MKGDDCSSFSDPRGGDGSFLDKQESEIQRITREHAANDPRSRLQTLIHGRDVPTDAATAISARNRHRLGKAKSLYRKPDTGGSAAFHAASASPEAAARVEGIPIVKLPDLGIVRQKSNGSLQPAGEGDMIKLRQGSEAQPFLDRREHVVYKVYTQNVVGGVGRRLSFTKEPSGRWHVGHEPAPFEEGLSKLQWIQEIGGLATEIHGITPMGQWVAKQPEAQHFAPDELQAALETAWKAARMVRIEAPDMDHVRVIWHRGEAWMMGDFTRGNIMRDAHGTPRFMDGNIGRIPEAMLQEMPEVFRAVEEAKRLAAQGPPS